LDRIDIFILAGVGSVALNKNSQFTQVHINILLEQVTKCPEE